MGRKEGGEKEHKEERKLKERRKGMEWTDGRGAREGGCWTTIVLRGGGGGGKSR